MLLKIFVHKFLLDICHYFAGYIQASQVALLIKNLPVNAGAVEPACQCRRCKRQSFHLWVRKIPWRRKWPPTPIFLLGESYRQRSLVGYSPQGHKELDMAEAT